VMVCETRKWRRDRLTQGTAEEVHPAVGINGIPHRKRRIRRIDDSTGAGSGHQGHLVIEAVDPGEIPSGQLRENTSTENIGVDLDRQPRNLPLVSAVHRRHGGRGGAGEVPHQFFQA
jgi:hypothetical protein